MASKPTVTLTFAGDSDKLERAMSKVGDSSQRMAREVGDSSDKMRRSFDDAGNAVDPYEGRMQGVSDVTSGVVEGFKGLTDSSLSVSERLQMLGGAGADLAGGMAYLLPFVGQLAGALKTGLGSALSFIAAHPIVFALIGLAALFVLLWTRSETFRAIVMAVFNAIGAAIGATVGWLKDRWHDFLETNRIIWDRIRGFVGGAINWIIDFGRGFLSFYLSMPGRILDAFRGIGEGIAGFFRAGFNMISRAWNSTVGRLSWTVPSWVPGIGGNSISAPRLPTFHTGGVVPGMPGQEVLALLRAGERVSTSTGSAGLVVRFEGDVDSAFATAFMALVRSGAITLEAA